VKDRIEKLAEVSDFWLTLKNPLREDTIQALQISTSLGRRQVEAALANCFEELTRSKMESHFTPYLQGKREHLDVLHILPSNVFTAWVHGAVTTLLLGHKCILKPSMREPVFAPAWKKSLELVDPLLGSQVEIVAWDEKRLQACEGIVAYGSDETLQSIRSMLPAGVRFAGYGHKLSVGIVFNDAPQDHLVDEIRKDADPFRLQGCLSPQILYIENYNGHRWPELEAILDVTPKIRPFERWSQVAEDLGKFEPYLSCVGYAGMSERSDFLSKNLSSGGHTRICPIGEMQRPPLSWRNGGIDLANLLN
jgi:hypothetical protein